jgi:hypothetical protein
MCLFHPNVLMFINDSLIYDVRLYGTSTGQLYFNHISRGCYNTSFLVCFFFFEGTIGWIKKKDENEVVRP